MSKSKKSLKVFVSFILSVLTIVTTTLGCSIVAQAAPVSGQAIVNEAMRHLGTPYAWGTTGPNSFDCSGLTSYVYKTVANIDIGRSTYEQINSGREVSQNELQPGDLVFPSDHHVGIYVGNGEIIHAPETNDVVKISPIWSFWRARRITNVASDIEGLTFDPTFYYYKYQDLRNAFGLNPDKLCNHFYSNGIKEGREASEVFDSSYYLSHNQDLINAFGSNNYEAAYNHFINCGYKETRKYSPVFDLNYYIKNNPDVAKAYGNDYKGIINHFLVCGMKEGRAGSENFNLEIYKFNYEDLRNAFGDNNKTYYDHYLQCGINEGRVANHVAFKTTIGNLIFNAKFYADKYPDLKNAFGYDELKLAKHFMACGIKEGRSASEVFDVNYYLSNNPDLIAAFGKNNYQAAYDHFLSNGYKESRKLSPVFDMCYYIKSNPDVAAAYGNDYKGIINHFLVCGMKEGRTGSEGFILNVYKNKYVDLRNIFGDNNKSYYDHYLQYGVSEGRRAK